MHWWLVLVSTFLAIALTTAVQAAKFQIVDATDKQFPTVMMTGEIKPGDFPKFQKSAGSLVGAIVYLEGPGGSAIDALRIGEVIRARGFTTAINPRATCASACALTWLSGSVRYIGAGARLGFHTVFVTEGKTRRESGNGNALVGAYLVRLGFGYDAVNFVTRAGPTQINWLTEADSVRAGIFSNWNAMPSILRPKTDARPAGVIPIPRPKPIEVLMMVAVNMKIAPQPSAHDPVWAPPDRRDPIILPRPISNTRPEDQVDCSLFRDPVRKMGRKKFYDRLGPEQCYSGFLGLDRLNKDYPNIVEQPVESSQMLHLKSIRDRVLPEPSGGKDWFRWMEMTDDE